MATGQGNTSATLWSLENTWLPEREGSRKLHSVLLGFGSIVFPLAGVPQEKGDAYGGQGHDSKGCPVQLWRKTRARLGVWMQMQDRTGTKGAEFQPLPRPVATSQGVEPNPHLTQILDSP